MEALAGARLPDGERLTSALAAARALAPRIVATADETERGRRVPPALVAALAEAGLFRMAVPRALGGGEVTAAELLAAIEEVARADGSTGWVVMIGATSGLVSAYLPDGAARELYGDPLGVTGGVFAPRGRATAVDGGWRVSGRWPFASGCEHCAWLMGGCTVTDAGGPRLLGNGALDPVMMLVPAGDARIVDTWQVAGLCGTGSHDFTVDDAFVPAERAVSLVTDRPRHGGSLYRLPAFGLLAVAVAAVTLGIARRAIDELVALARAKTPTGSRRPLAERGTVQVDVARAEAMVRAARALLHATVAEAERGTGELGTPERAALRLAATHAATSAATAVDLMYAAGGATAIYASSALQRCFRDVHTATQHVMVAPATGELVGRLLLGLTADTTML